MNDKDYLPTHVNLKLNGKCNEVLTKSAIKNNRTKRAEAAIRLKHHLENFDQNWSENKTP